MGTTTGFGRNSATHFTATMPPTSEQLWDAIDRIYNEDGTAGRIPPAVIAKLIEFKRAELSATGLPQAGVLDVVMVSPRTA
jgi:hypothetical protein